MDATPPVKSLVEALLAHLETVRKILELMIEFLERHGDAVSLLSDINRLERYIHDLSDEDASLLFRALLAYNRAILNIAATGVTFDANVLAELRDRIEEAVAELSKLLAMKQDRHTTG